MSGESRSGLGHARIASSPASPFKVNAGDPLGGVGITPLAASKPPSYAPPPLVLPGPPSDVPPPPVLAVLPKVPPLALATLSSVSAPVISTSGVSGMPDVMALTTCNLPASDARPDSPVPTPPTPKTPQTPHSPTRLDTGGSLKGDDVKLELRYFIDSVLEHRVEGGHRDYAEDLGELLVFVESKGGMREIGSDTRNSVLRGTAKIKDYTTTSGAVHPEVNVIRDFSQPFMNKLLGSGESDKVRLKLLRAFDKVADKVSAMNQQGQDVRTSDLLKNDEFIQLMQPIEQMFMDYVCGANRTLGSSRLPEPMKKLLLTIDQHLIAWFEQRGNGVNRDLLEMRQNAQVGYLATRSITAVWRSRCDEELGVDAAKKYAKLFTYLNACVSLKLGDFVLDIISNQKAQPKEVREYVRAVQHPKSLVRSKGTTVVPPASESSVLSRGKTLQATSQLISPRSDSSEGLNSPRGNDAVRQLKREQVQHQLARANFAEQIIAEAGLKEIDPRFMQHLKDKIVDLRPRGFENFKLDPISYCQKYAIDFYAYGGNVQKAGKGAPEKVAQALMAVDATFRKNHPLALSMAAPDNRDRKVGNDATTITTTTTTRTTTTTTTTAVPPLPLGTITAPANPVTDGADSSSEVGTPSSDDKSWGSDWVSSEESEQS